MRTDYAVQSDLSYLSAHDQHIPVGRMKQKIERREVILARTGARPAGWLRFSLFWDEIPFMNLLFVEEAERGKGLGRELIRFWEAEMRAAGHRLVMTSTMSDEQAQHLYRKLGYQDCGALRMPGEALEIILMKEIQPARSEA